MHTCMDISAHMAKLQSHLCQQMLLGHLAQLENRSTEESHASPQNLDLGRKFQDPG